VAASQNCICQVTLLEGGRHCCRPKPHTRRVIPAVQEVVKPAAAAAASIADGAACERAALASQLAALQAAIASLECRVEAKALVMHVFGRLRALQPDHAAARAPAVRPDLPSSVAAEASSPSASAAAAAAAAGPAEAGAAAQDAAGWLAELHEALRVLRRALEWLHVAVEARAYREAAAVAPDGGSSSGSSDHASATAKEIAEQGQQVGGCTGARGSGRRAVPLALQPHEVCGRSARRIASRPWRSTHLAHLGGCRRAAQG
jgi:hypothetical protein